MVQNKEVPTYEVAVVGGGIKGMYCMAEKGLKVGLFEMANRWG